MCPGARVAALSSVLQYLAQEKLSALVLRIFEELLGLIILDDLVRVDKEYSLGFDQTSVFLEGSCDHFDTICRALLKSCGSNNTTCFFPQLDIPLNEKGALKRECPEGFRHCNSTA